MEDVRWKSPFPYTLAFNLFKKHFTELNEAYWAFVPANNTIKALAKKQLHKDSDDPPTQKQIDLVKKLCKEKKLNAPEKWSKKAYSGFIYHNTKKKEK